MAAEGVAGDAPWYKEMAALQAQLRASVKLQMEKTRDGIRSLSASQDVLREAGGAIERVATLCRESEGLIDNYPFIKQVSRTHQNFLVTKRVYDEFHLLDDRVTRCGALLEADAADGEPNNLLLIYMYISRLSSFQRQTMEMMRDAPSTSIYVIKRYFKRVEDLVASFDAFFWSLTARLFELASLQARGNAPQHIAAIAGVLSKMEVEEKPRFYTLLTEIIAQKFAPATARAASMRAHQLGGGGGGGGEDLIAILDDLSFWLPDLIMVRDQVALKFPPSFNLLDFVVLTYHRNIHDVIMMCISPPTVAAVAAKGAAGKSQGPAAASLAPAQILYTLGWVRTYHDELASHLGISEDHVEPRLLEDREEALIQAYVALSSVKISEWITNLLAVECRALIERPQEPDTDADNQYMTPGGIDLFQIVKQHIDTAAQASRGRLLLAVIGQCAQAVVRFQETIGAALERAAPPNVIEASSEGGGGHKKGTAKGEAAPFYEEHVIMVGNMALKWVAYLDELGADVAGKLADEFASEAAASIKMMGDGFIGLARRASLLLVSVIFASLRPAILQLFTPIWYAREVNLVGTIVATFDDYLTDFCVHSDPFLFNKLTSDVIERILVVYIDQMRQRSSKLAMPAAAALLAEDNSSLADYFGRLRDPARVAKALEPHGRFIDLVTASPRMVFLEYVSVSKAFPDLPLGLVEDVLGRRDDLEKATIREIVANCKKKAVEEARLGASDGAPSSGSGARSIFSKISTHKGASSPQ